MGGCDGLGTLVCQAAESKIRLDNVEAGEQVSRQTEGPRDGRSSPSPMEVSKIGMWEKVSDVLSKIGPYAQEIDDPSEVTSPQKPTNPSQTCEANRE